MKALNQMVSKSAQSLDADISRRDGSDMYLMEIMVKHSKLIHSMSTFDIDEGRAHLLKEIARELEGRTTTPRQRVRDEAISTKPIVDHFSGDEDHLNSKRFTSLRHSGFQVRSFGNVLNQERFAFGDEDESSKNKSTPCPSSSEEELHTTNITKTLSKKNEQDGSSYEKSSSQKGFQEKNNKLNKSLNKEHSGSDNDLIYSQCLGVSSYAPGFKDSAGWMSQID